VSGNYSGAGGDSGREEKALSQTRRGNLVPKAYFMVRSVVTEPLRQKFDRWYSTDHLPRALADFKAEKAWRFWSTMDASVHYAVYQFTDPAKLDAAMKSQEFKDLIVDFDKSFPTGVTRTRDLLNLAEERLG
jgi:hypothetical protein